MEQSDTWPQGTLEPHPLSWRLTCQAFHERPLHPVAPGVCHSNPHLTDSGLHALIVVSEWKEESLYVVWGSEGMRGEGLAHGKEK